MKKQTSKAVILDSNSLVHRAYHALPPLKTPRGCLVNVVYGFISIFFKIINDTAPAYVAAAFDLEGPTFRDEIYHEYKAKRVRPSQEMYDQIPLIKEFLDCLSVAIYEKKGFEADDIIGTIVEKNSSRPLTNIIITGDLDTLQLVNSKTRVYLSQGGGRVKIYDFSSVKERYGFAPCYLPDFRGLRGDPSDNISGVPGIGEKTAQSLIVEFGRLEKLYQEIEKSSLDQKIKSRLLEYKGEAFLSKRLSEIKRDAPIPYSLRECQWGGYDRKKANDFLEGLGFKSLVGRLP